MGKCGFVTGFGSIFTMIKNETQLRGARVGVTANHTYTITQV
jgi:hypothetical protein